MTNKRRAIYRILSSLAVCTVMITIFILSAQNSTQSNETSGFLITFLSNLFNYNFSQEFIRTLAHFCEYALLGFLMHNAIFSYKYSTQTLLALLISWGYAWTDEIHQLLKYNYLVCISYNTI